MQKEISRKKCLSRQDHQTWDHRRGARGSGVGWSGPGTCPAGWTLLCCDFEWTSLSSYFCSFLPWGLWGLGATVCAKIPSNRREGITVDLRLPPHPVHPPWSSEGVLWLRTPLSPHHLQAWFRVLVSEEGKEFWHMRVVWKFQNRQLCQITTSSIWGRSRRLGL